MVLRLTDTGRTAAETIRQTLIDLETESLRGLPAETVAGFHTVLRALTERPT